MMAQFSDLHLMRPEWLWCLLPAFILAFLLWYFRGKGGSWSDVIAPELLPFLVGKQQASRGPNLLPVLFLAWIIAAVAAAGPAWEKLPQPIQQKQDALVLVLDLSYSMKAQDLSPSRLMRARQKILDLLDERGEGQTGLIAYAGDAHIVTPLTDDNPTIANLIPALNPDMMPIPGSDPLSAVAQAIALLRSAGVSGGKILLITDGVSENAAKEMGDELSGTGVALAVLGIGTSAGAPIPLSQGGFIKDDNGNIVIPTLDESALRSLASSAGGKYARISLDDNDLERLLGEPLRGTENQTLTLDRTADAWEDMGYLLVLLLLPIALTLFRRGWVLCLLPVVFFSASPQQANAQSWDDLWLTPDQQGRKALQNNENGSAAMLFEDPDWAATAAYRDEDFERAVNGFSETKTADSWYNRGNALAKAGELDDAIAAYKESLQLQPEKKDAIENIELLEKMKEQQDQQEQEQNQEQDQDQDQDQDQESQDQQDQQGEQQQSDDQSDPGEQNNDEQQEPEQETEQSAEPEQEQEQEQENESQQEPAEEEQTPEDQEEQEASMGEQAEASAEEKEQEQAMEQWLRRVPDDPSGLLREKFRYESRQREQQGKVREDETYW